MIVVLILMSLMFIGLAFLLNQRNASTLLAGYNTMSQEEQQGFNLKGYLKLFKSFHFFLGISFGFLGALIMMIWGEDVMGLFIGVYPIAAYMWFIHKTS